MSNPIRQTKPTPVEKSASSGPRSLTRLLGLFDILAQNSDGLTLADLSEALKSPKSSLLNLFRPLVAEEYLSHTGGHYKLGPSIYRLSAKIMKAWNFSGLIHPYVEELAKATQETVYLGLLDKDASLITYVDAIDSQHSIRYPINVGTTRPLYCTAAGRVLLAYEDPAWVHEYLKTVPIERRTSRTITDRRLLRSKLAEIRDTGISISIGEMFEELGAIAAPVFGADGNIAAALAIGAPVEKLENDISQLTTPLIDIAARASGNPQVKPRT